MKPYAPIRRAAFARRTYFLPSGHDSSGIHQVGVGCMNLASSPTATFTSLFPRGAGPLLYSPGPEVEGPRLWRNSGGGSEGENHCPLPFALEWRAPDLARNCLAGLGFSGLDVHSPERGLAPQTACLQSFQFVQRSI